MSELRERLQEAADAAAREGRHPPAAALVRRGRRRRLRRVGGTAVLVVLVMVAGMVGADRLSQRPLPLTPTPTAGPASTTIPTKATAPPRWIPSVTPLRIKDRRAERGWVSWPVPAADRRRRAHAGWCCEVVSGDTATRVGGGVVMVELSSAEARSPARFVPALGGNSTRVSRPASGSSSPCEAPRPRARSQPPNRGCDVRQVTGCSPTIRTGPRPSTPAHHA
jgi:hypothetical protein